MKASRSGVQVCFRKWWCVVAVEGIRHIGPTARRVSVRCRKEMEEGAAESRTGCDFVVQEWCQHRNSSRCARWDGGAAVGGTSGGLGKYWGDFRGQIPPICSGRQKSRGLERKVSRACAVCPSVTLALQTPTA